jgi:diamine N-acetyltransferase
MVECGQRIVQKHRHTGSEGVPVTIVLQPVTRDNWRETLHLRVHPDQQRFVTDHVPIAAIALAKAFVRPGGLVWVPYAIYAGMEVVGLIELAYEPESCDQYWVYHFFIDEAHQRKGYGKAALHAYVQLVREEHPAAKRIQLAVHPENTHAQQLYTSVGFQPMGKELDGEPVYMLNI